MGGLESMQKDILELLNIITGERKMLYEVSVLTGRFWLVSRRDAIYDVTFQDLQSQAL